MKKIIFFFAFVILTCISLNAQKKVNWLSFEKAMELHKVTPKPFIVDVYTDWCGWCKKMDKETYSNATIVSYINKNYYAVKLDGEEKKDIIYKEKTYTYKKNGRKGYHELAAVLLSGRLSYPATVFLNKEGNVIQNVPGYQNKERFEKIISFFSDDNYKTIKWEVFEEKFESKI
jgi:thioredoxin-related protein